MFRIFVAAALSVASGTLAAIPGHSDSRGADLDKVVCKSVKEIGSRIPTRICRSAREWLQIEQDAREAVDRIRRNNQCTGAGCN
jgi:hypothetical protein